MIKECCPDPSLADAAPPLAGRTPGRPKRVPRTPPPATLTLPSLHSRSRSTTQVPDLAHAAVQRAASEHLGDNLSMLPAPHMPLQAVSLLPSMQGSKAKR